MAPIRKRKSALLLSPGAEKEIAKLAETVLAHADIQDAQPLNGVIPVRILTKQFNYPEEVPHIVSMINKQERRRILYVFSEDEFVRHLQRLGADKMTVENVEDLLKTRRSTLDLQFGVGEMGIMEADKSFRFFIQDANRLRAIAEEAESAQSVAKKRGGLVHLYLNNAGELRRRPESKTCYPMRQGSDRHKILLYLAAHGGYQRTSDISQALDGKSEDSIREQIRQIRRNIKKFLHIGGRNVIEAETGNGYRIGSGYRIHSGR